MPSQVVATIDALYAHAAASNEMYAGFKFHEQDLAKLAGILELVDHVPPELIVLPPADYASLVCATGAIRAAVGLWQARGGTNQKLREPLANLDVVTAIRRIMARCPDSYATADTPSLQFVEDEAYRTQLRVDLSDGFRALANGEWKAATVLAGSVIEALILWRIKKHATLEQEIGGFVAGGLVRKKVADNPDEWSAGELIAIAHKLGVITDQARDQASLAKDFRNLIHPGRSIRVDQTCDRSTALTALAAAECLMREFARWSAVG